MKRIDVPVQFSGMVTVLVPKHLSANDAKLLANNLVLARILATSANAPTICVSKRTDAFITGHPWQE